VGAVAVKMSEVDPDAPLRATPGGEKLQLAPLGRPEQLKLTVLLKLPVGVRVMVLGVEVVPRVTVTAEELSASRKLPCAAAVSVSGVVAETLGW
jgi:hypothetical protein